ncbi:DinB family protein [Agarivorans sp. TSD2052]|uniref:DinB family protein n=1 Tax=Agarivorans sp. TSD2052 TaxID=2937286 RepID=UPI00200F167B|nr:DinB family protein [Agarivorans sp. TSD2052]UPW19015.1 DinB family protein [Agarivorans sp. TSD2052]
MKSAFELMAQYNQEMNLQVYTAAQQLSQQQLEQNRGAFFGSIFATLNHILVGDTLWLQRFAAHPRGFGCLADMSALPSPKALDAIIHTDLSRLAAAREAMDKVIVAFTQQLTEQDLQLNLTYLNSKGVAHCQLFGSLVLHFFNHQTHHRGQVSTMLSQQGIDLGVTDLLLHIPEAKKSP